MDKIDQHLRDIFSQLNSEDTPKDFYLKINDKIELKKGLQDKRKEDLLLALFITVLSIGFFGCLFLLNMYYFHIDAHNFADKTKNFLLDTSEMFSSKYASLWSIIGISALILILLEQFLSRKLSNMFRS